MAACEACTLATKGHTGLFHASCAGCNARALARSPDFFESQRTRTQTAAYRAALRAMGITHDDVKAAAAADKGSS